MAVMAKRKRSGDKTAVVSGSDDDGSSSKRVKRKHKTGDNNLEKEDGPSQANKGAQVPNGAAAADAKAKKVGKDTLREERAAVLESANKRSLPNGAADKEHSGKRSRKKKASDRKDREPVSHSGQVEGLAPAAQLSKRQRSSQESTKQLEAKERKKRKYRPQDPAIESGSSWIVTPAVGGLQSNLDPVFSNDEEYLIVAYHDSIRVFASASSLLFRSLKLRKRSIVASFHLSRSNPTQLYICFADGQVQLWNWRDGTWLQSWDIKSRILDSTCSTIHDKSDALFTVDEMGGKWMITAHQLQGMDGVEHSAQKTLYRTESPISMLRVLGNGRCVVATDQERVVVGSRRDESPDVKGLNYKWWEFSVKSGVTTLDIKENAEMQAKPKWALSLDLVVGCQDGTIQYYLDIVNKLTDIEKSKRVKDPPNTTLHWHRSSIGAVRWSQDGNYLISGGAETVLTLWQLDTAGRSFLPHLSSPIESIVVSPTGTSYAIRLADNSTMTISTQELQPTMNIPGVLLPSLPQRGANRNMVDPRPYSIARRPAVAVSKRNPPQILLAAPAVASSQSHPGASPSATQLQTIDARSGTQLARQALTRTKITDRNMGPDGIVIDDPDVILLQVSSDGNWLATVEEWCPPARDLDPAAVGPEELLMNRAGRLESNLKFWSWSEVSLQWELVTRIDRPHPISSELKGASGVVLDLIADPSSSAFLTLGDNGEVRMWKPKPRYRNNVPVKDTRGLALMNWSCRQIIRLPLSSSISKASSRASISQDGSMFAIAQSTQSEAVMYIVDARSSHILSIRTDMFSGLLRDVAILGPYLIILASQLVVWNLVDDRLSWALDLGYFSNIQLPHKYLVINPESNTFAIALSEEKQRRGPRTRAAIFTPTCSTPFLITETTHVLIALVSAFNQKTFYGLDSAARVLSMVPFTHVETSQVEVAEIWSEEPPIAQGMEKIYGSKLIKDYEENAKQATRLVVDPTEESNVVRQHQLTELFNYTQPFALPPVTSLFEQVAGLISGIKNDSI